MHCTAQEGVSSQHVQILDMESGYVALKPNILDMCNLRNIGKVMQNIK